MPFFKNTLLVAALLGCSAMAWAQKGPATAMGGTTGGDVTASYVVMVKSASFDVGYEGADVSMTKYVTRHWGVRAEGDLERMNSFAYREYGVRGGPVYRFSPRNHVQPYIHYLVGYARAKGTIFPGPRVYHSGLSMLGGGGVDYRLKNGWFVRGGADIVADNNTTNGFGNKYARVTFGLAYHFTDPQ